MLHRALTNQSTVSVDISFNSLPLAEASMKANNLIDDLTNRFMQTMRNAWIIARYFDLDQNIEVVPLELLKQETAISVIAGAIERHEANYEVGFLLPSTPPDEGLLYCIPWIRRAVIGTQRLVVALALIGQKIEPTGE